MKVHGFPRREEGGNGSPQHPPSEQAGEGRGETGDLPRPRLSPKEMKRQQGSGSTERGERLPRPSEEGGAGEGPAPGGAAGKGLRGHAHGGWGHRK